MNTLPRSRQRGQHHNSSTAVGRPHECWMKGKLSSSIRWMIGGPLVREEVARHPNALASTMTPCVFSPTLGLTPLQQSQVEDRWPLCSRRGTRYAVLCLECSDPRWPPRSTQCGRVSLPKESGQCLQGFLEAQPRPPDNSEAGQKCATGSSSRNKSQSIDQGPTQLRIARFATQVVSTKVQMAVITQKYNL